MSPPRIMVVEDEAIVVMDLKRRLQLGGYEVVAATGNGAKAIALAGKLRPDLVLMDIHLRGDLDGIETAREIRERHEVPVIYLTAFGEDATFQRAKATARWVICSSLLTIASCAPSSSWRCSALKPNASCARANGAMPRPCAALPMA